MHSHFTRTWRTKIAAGASAAVLSAFALIASVQAADPNTPVDAIKTATPIKHVIIIVGENRSFDHLFATYQCGAGEYWQAVNVDPAFTPRERPPGVRAFYGATPAGSP